MKRRLLVKCSLALVATSFVTACEQEERHTRVLSLGGLEQFAIGMTDRPIERLRLIKDRNGLGAMSTVCTHQSCVVRVAEDRTLLCPCHGSQFDEGGKVLKGPAPSDLPWFLLSLSERNEVLVHFDELKPPSWRLQLPR